MVEIIKCDEKLNQKEIYNKLKREVGLEKTKHQSDKKVLIQNISYETEDYCSKFKNKNNFIVSNGEYFTIKKIELEPVIELTVKKLLVEQISINTVRIIKEIETMRSFDEYDDFSKLVPTMVNGKIYISKRPNLIFNE